MLADKYASLQIELLRPSILVAQAPSLVQAQRDGPQLVSLICGRKNDGERFASRLRPEEVVF